MNYRLRPWRLSNFQFWGFADFKIWSPTTSISYCSLMSTPKNSSFIFQEAPEIVVRPQNDSFSNQNLLHSHLYSALYVCQCVRLFRNQLKVITYVCVYESASVCLQQPGSVQLLTARDGGVDCIFPVIWLSLMVDGRGKAARKRGQSQSSRRRLRRWNFQIESN